MAGQDAAARRQRKLASYHRRVAERRERGLCIKCGKCPPAPDRSICASCGEKARAAERARTARLRAEGKPARDPETRRQADRERDRRQHAERKAAGLCVKCGRAPALPARTQCEPCAERRKDASYYTSLFWEREGSGIGCRRVSHRPGCLVGGVSGISYRQ